MLFNIRADASEKHNLIKENPEIAQGLKKHLTPWANELQPPGMPSGKMTMGEIRNYDYYFGKE